MSNRAMIAGVIQSAIDTARRAHPERIPLVGVAGAQGSGKSFQCRAFAAAHSPSVAHFSLDDVYLTKSERAVLARNAHSLFATRGPPGTHDLGLAERTLDDLQAGGPALIPRFDKAADDRAPAAQWTPFSGPATAILFDGWCVGALPLGDLDPPLNALERDEDADGAWRAAVGAALEGPYQSFFDRFDAFVYLQAPSFEIVRRWRGQQEEEMLGRAMNTAERATLDRFIQHYERITRAMLDGRHRARWVVRLDEERNVVGVEDRG
ncbi:MAG TPA: kinase [Caulobacterales bacterium]|nr:kinase [Caulobacterales bacterium]